MKVEWITDPNTREAVPLPGVCHPALTEEAKVLATADDRPHILLPVPRPPSVGALWDGAVAAPQNDVRVFTHRQAHASLDHKFGAYLWTVWMDGLGRSAGMDDTRWSPNPQAATRYGEWNPGPLVDGPPQDRSR